MDENVYWIWIVSIITAGVMVLIICFSTVIIQSNEQVLKADSCVKAVLISGGNTEAHLLSCGNK